MLGRIGAAFAIGQQAGRLAFLTVTADKGFVFGHCKLGFHFIGKESFEIDFGVIQHLLCCGRISVNFARVEVQRLERRSIGFGAGIFFTYPTAARAVHIVQFAEFRLRGRLNLKQTAQRRNSLQLVGNGTVPFLRHQIAAVGIVRFFQIRAHFAGLHKRHSRINSRLCFLIEFARTAIHLRGGHLYRQVVDRGLEFGNFGFGFG